jgi:hypothetical protein
MKAHDLLTLSDLCMQAGAIAPISPDELDRLPAYTARLLVRKLLGLR